MKTLLAFLLVLLLSACAGSATKTYILPEGLGQVVATSPLACRFEKHTTDGKNTQKSNWYFWRETQRTETRDELSNQGEIWERNSAGQYFFTRLFFNERVALEFVPGDLAAMGSSPSWQQLSSLIDPKTLGKELKPQGKGSAGGLSVEYYSGTINNVVTEIDWLPDLQLPARLVKKLSDITVILTVSDCGNVSKFAAKPITKPEFDKLRRLDYTDLGDMEDDPMVRHLELLMGGHHHENH